MSVIEDANVIPIGNPVEGALVPGPTLRKAAGVSRRREEEEEKRPEVGEPQAPLASPTPVRGQEPRREPERR
jgi:hypothetical protein